MIKKRHTAKTKQKASVVTAPLKERSFKSAKKRKLIITRTQRTKEDIEMEN